ncbi:MAG TPA: hypothetical protein VFE36_02580 [Candidatus Baltobacteraceae bacterium]|jgi:hypothetical protein|nr:hypothetical protein [Candidatus Baltobacteraceae bacterium]
MIVLAHVMMIPVEEMLVPLAASGAGAGIVLWLTTRVGARK